MKQSQFKPIMISFAKKEYEQKQNQANDKLKVLDEASVWIHKSISPQKVDMKKLSNNMVAYFKDLVLETFVKQNTLGLSADKLIEAKEIDIAILREIQRIYDSMSIPVSFKNGEAYIKIERKDYETWTVSQKQNERLLIGSKFVTALNEMDKIHPVAKMFATRLTNGYVIFDMYKNGFQVNPEMLRI